LEDQVAVRANQDPQVKEDKAVDVDVTGPAQAPPSIEAMEERVPCEDVVGLQEPGSYAIISELFEKWEAGLVAGNQAFYFEEANVKVSVVYCGASTHGTAATLLPKGVAKLENVATHDFSQGFDEEVHRHALR
jgi:hypothetical protein